MFTQEKLDNFRKMLLQHRSRILNRTVNRELAGFSMNQEDLVDENDHAASMVQQSLTIEVQERDRKILQEIDAALAKFENDTYGICEDTEEYIDEARLMAQPWARYSIEAAEIREKRSKKYAGHRA